MQEPAALNDLRRMSARVGKNILLTQAAGGNSSIKLGDVLWVKASGAWLADAEDKDVFLARLRGFALENADFEIFSTAK
jgi:rhamnose utilization protein RhaD (predicted bifunctional aldolase and dehydrogenase)